MIQTAIIEDDPGIRTYLSEFLNMQSDIICIGSYNSVEEFLEHGAELTGLEILLLDINLPGISGVKGIPAIKNLLPNLDIIILSVHSQSEVVFEALCAGANGYLLKSTSLSEIAEAIRTHNQGGSAMSPSIARMAIRNFIQQAPKSNSTATSQDFFQDLTSREKEVLEALADGLSYKLIAEKLHMSPSTLPVHIRNIYKKLQINSKSEALALFYRNKS